MRQLVAVSALLLSVAPAEAQRLGPFHLSAEMVLSQVDVDTGVGMAGTVLVRTPGRYAGYLAARPEWTARNEGGTGFTYSTDAVQLDGFTPDFAYTTCRSDLTGEAVASSRCGLTGLGGALSGEVGTRLAVGRGAVLAGLGLRGGHGSGVYGALMGRLAAPLFFRVEVGTGHAAVGLGAGGL